MGSGEGSSHSEAEVRTFIVGGWGQEMMLDQNQMPVSSFHLHSHLSQAQPLPSLYLWDPGWLGPGVGMCEELPAQGKHLALNHILLAISPCLSCLASMTNSLTPCYSDSQPLMLECPQPYPIQALKLCHGFSSPTSCTLVVMLQFQLSTYIRDYGQLPVLHSGEEWGT